MLPYDPAKRIPAWNALLVSPEHSFYEGALRDQLRYLATAPSFPFRLVYHDRSTEYDFTLTSSAEGCLRADLLADGNPDGAILVLGAGGDLALTGGTPQLHDELCSLVYNLDNSVIPQFLA